MNRQFKELIADFLAFSGTILCVILLFLAIPNVSAKEPLRPRAMREEEMLLVHENIIKAVETGAKDKELYFHSIMEWQEGRQGQMDPELRTVIESMSISK